MEKRSFSDIVLNTAGKPIMGATVSLYVRNTVTPVLATTLTDSNGGWTISYTPTAPAQAGPRLLRLLLMLFYRQREAQYDIVITDTPDGGVSNA